MKLLILSEVSDDTYRVHYEAQVLSLLDEVDNGALEISLVCAQEDPHLEADTPIIETIKLPIFPTNRGECVALMETFERYLAGQPSGLLPDEEEQFVDLIEAVRKVDAVLTIGNNVMSSQAPNTLYEMAVLVAVCHRVGVPVVCTSQLVGTPLVETDALALVRTYQRASLVCVADQASHIWCSNHAIDAAPSVDVATTYGPRVRSLTGAPTYDLFKNVGELDNAYIGVAFTDLAEHLIEPLAKLLDRLHAATGYHTVFIAHETDPDTGQGDVQLHQRIAEKMKSRPVLTPALHADVVAGLHHSAAFNITNLHRAAALSLGRGVPVFGFYNTISKRVGLESVLANFGMTDFVAPDTQMQSPDVFEALLELADRFESHLNLNLYEHARQVAEFAHGMLQIIMKQAERGVFDRDALDSVPAPPQLKIKGRHWRVRLKNINDLAGELLARCEHTDLERVIADEEVLSQRQQCDALLRQLREDELRLRVQHNQIEELQGELAAVQRPRGLGRWLG